MHVCVCVREVHKPYKLCLLCVFFISTFTVVHNIVPCWVSADLLQGMWDDVSQDTSLSELSTYLISIPMSNLWLFSSLYALEPICHFPLCSLREEVLLLVRSRQESLPTALKPLMAGRLGTCTVSKVVSAWAFLQVIKESFQGV